ncbi:MAG: P-II family nitrogen regulator [Bacillota bacterium]|jgi:nitrogen regulatory protein PII|nr:P-II family nitrogen regulator [Bacillota bacterium]HOB91211.1 P-II family nitrogen regulator [Bacillota bacterium]HPZ54338.1 P-II family nitrogen regulator [Bacillota bacterium]HQD17621.1 P-II family nitrogen regulator [Bacillota bacterium]
MTYNTIFAVLPRGKADSVMEAAKKAGAPGGTIFFARGTGAHEAKTFFGLTIETAKEVLMIVTKDEDTDRILETVIEAGRLTEPAAGIAFVVRGVDVYGLYERGKPVHPHGKRE